MRPSRGGVHKKSKTMDYTNYAYNEAVGRLKMMLADSYTAPKTNTTCSYLRSFNDDSADNYSDNMSTIDRPVFADISKYLSPSQKSRLGGGSYRPKKTLSGFSASKENLTSPARQYQTTVLPTAAVSSSGAVDYYASTPKAQMPPTDSVQAPVEIFNFIEKQEDYIEQLEKESKYCRNELSNLLGKVKDVINENEQLTEHARSELNNLGKSEKITTSPSSDSDDILYTNKKTSTPRKKEVKSPRYASAPNIVYEARISELEAELMQANIDLKRVKTENDDLKKKLARSDISTSSNSALNCEAHRKQIELLQKDKTTLEETIRQLHKSLDEAKSQQYSQSSKRYINDLVQMERSQAELEVRHLRDELDRQHERVRELQHEMARRLADERANAERRYNNQVDQLGGDLSSQWEQVAKLQLDLERQKRYENDLKRDLANRNSQIEELKMELRANRSTFLADMAQVNAEKQSLEQEITALRLQLDRASRENKTEAARLNAEINSLRQRLDRADADLLHSKREVLRLNDEIANLEKELAYGEMKNEIRPTKKDLDKRISEMQEKHENTTLDLQPQQQPQTSTTTQIQPAPENLKDNDGLTMDVVKTPAVETQTPATITTQPKEEITTKELVLVQPAARENVNVYTSRFDDEHIWENISRSTERLDLEWAKMAPLPKLTTSTSSKTNCHCQLYKKYSSRESLISDMCKCNKGPLRTSYKHSDLTKYGNTVTKNLSFNNKNTNKKTTIAQPLKPTTTIADCHLFHHRHNLTLDLKHPCTKRDNKDQNLDNTLLNIENTNTNDTSTSNTSTHYERSNSRTKFRKSPRLDCHSRTRCYSHDRLMDYTRTEPLTWLQQHLVLKQTIKTCHTYPTTTMNYENAATPACHRYDDTPSTTCCQGQHVLRACCNNKECLKVVEEPTAKKQEQDKSTNTENMKEEKLLSKKKPVKVDINVRLVPKSTKREKSKSAVKNQDTIKVDNEEPLEARALADENPQVDILELDNQEIRTEF
ncbi:rho-associated protein kinase 1 isoform X2 [Lucilia cuprina]|uniref:rho-associated protein kinase 1 isoform X2 n=1 Tax=Lucilia cuprina TaxID=7375 RepID=UPI001F064E29|nr:rho-associated protein kinase 1 isoform X2 [Lucilia cuprina]